MSQFNPKTTVDALYLRYEDGVPLLVQTQAVCQCGFRGPVRRGDSEEMLRAWTKDEREHCREHPVRYRVRRGKVIAVPRTGPGSSLTYPQTIRSRPSKLPGDSARRRQLKGRGRHGWRGLYKGEARAPRAEEWE